MARRKKSSEEAKAVARIEQSLDELPITDWSLKGMAKPKHYKVLCISMYLDDLERLDAMVRALKARGFTKANRSALIRYALGVVELDKVPKGL